jgi:hypothetical protein
MRARYPSVIGEFDTLKALVAGASIARYGDGELKMCRVETPPVGIKSQRGDTALSDRLREILIDSGDCLVGIPNIHDVVKEHVSDQKVEHWARHAMYLTYLIDRPYYSSFITRPDSAPWIHTPDYWHLLVLLGLGPTATVLAVDLCRRGIHALDLGHVAMFLRKYRKGVTDPQLTHEEKYTEIPA